MAEKPLAADRGDRSGEYWDQRTKDRWFFAALAVCALAVAVLFSGFLTPLMFASVVAVVAWPLHARILRRVKRRGVAALLSTAALVVGVFGPLALVTIFFVREGIGLVGKAQEFVRSGAAEAMADDLLSTQATDLPGWLAWLLPRGVEVRDALREPLRNAASGVLDATSAWLPGLLSGTVNALIDGVLFFLAVITLFMEGPKLLRVFQNLIPIDDAYERRLFDVFHEISRNMVLGAVAVALAQGTVAGIGYGIAGAPRPVFFALLTAICSIVPIFGAGLVWVPLSIAVWVEHGAGWGVFMLLWGFLLTSQVDSIVRPLFMRGRSNVHPLLMFLAVFGGMAWLGLPGVLVGPVLLAFFLALYSIYTHDYLGRPDRAEPEVVEGADERPRRRFRLPWAIAPSPPT